jgi:hypothetical protein
LRDGHRFREVAGVKLPYEFCTRWFCDGAQVAGWVPESIRPALEAVIEEDLRANTVPGYFGPKEDADQMNSQDLQ